MSTQPPTRSGIGHEQHWLWLIGAVVYLLLHRGSNCSLTRAMDGHIMRCGIISSCQSAATFEVVNCFRLIKQRYIKYRTLHLLFTKSFVGLLQKARQT